MSKWRNLCLSRRWRGIYMTVINASNQGRTYGTSGQAGQGDLKKALPAYFVNTKAGHFFPSESGLNDLKERRQIFVRIMVVGKENIGVKVCNNL